MRGDAVLLQERLLGEVELERVVGAQADVEADLEEVRERVALVREEERVVAQRAHREPDLLEVEEVLQRRHLAQQDTVRDRVRGQERGRQVVRVSRLTAVRAEDEGACNKREMLKSSYTAHIISWTY